MEDSVCQRFRTRRIFGIPFLAESSARVRAAAWAPGLTVVPSGPGLASLPHDAAYANAVRSADRALTDSGLLVLAWAGLTGEWLPRTSGLRLVQEALDADGQRMSDQTLWVMPDAAEARRTTTYLRSRSMTLDAARDVYVAPMYSRQRIEDEVLLAQIRARNPRLVVLCLGSGVQEVLGWWLRQRLEPCPAIWCTGAALAFLTGGQAPIGTLVDRLMLGWLWRILHRPGPFLWRYGRAIPLVWALVQARRRLQ